MSRDRGACVAIAAAGLLSLAPAQGKSLATTAVACLHTPAAYTVKAHEIRVVAESIRLVRDYYTKLTGHVVRLGDVEEMHRFLKAEAKRMPPREASAGTIVQDDQTYRVVDLPDAYKATRLNAGPENLVRLRTGSYEVMVTDSSDRQQASFYHPLFFYQAN